MKRNRNNAKPKTQSPEMKYLQSPCTLAEAAQIARGVAEDVITDYHARTGHLQVAISMQIELLKSLLIESGIINEDEFKELYIQKVEEFNAMQREAAENAEDDEVDIDPNRNVSADMSTRVDEIEVQKI